jgi:hypothetical protein
MGLLNVGDVVVSRMYLRGRARDEGCWWLVQHPIGQDAVHIHGRLPRTFKGVPKPVTTFWDHETADKEGATINPPQPWPDEVCVAVAAFALMGRVPNG